MWLSVPSVTSLAPRRHEALGQRLGVVGDVLGVVGERRLPGLREGDRLGGHHVRQRTAEHHRAAAVDRAGVLLGRQHQPAARTAQRLVRGGGGQVRVRHRVLVAGEHLAGHQAGEVRHVHHQRGADLVGDLAHRGEVHPARVGGVAGDQDQRPELARRGPDPVVVEQPGLRVGAVGPLVEHLAADVRPEAVRQVAAGVQRHARASAGRPSSLAQRLPVLLGQLADVLGRQPLQGRGLDAVRQDRPERDQVGVDAGVRLDVGVRRAEQLAGVLGGERLDGVDVLAAGVEPVPDRALGVLVAEPGAHREQHGRGGVVLAGDQLERGALVAQLGPGGLGDPGLHGLDHGERGVVGRARGLRQALAAHRRAGGAGLVARLRHGPSLVHAAPPATSAAPPYQMMDTRLTS